MKKTILAFTAIAAALVGTAASAQPRDRDRDRDGIPNRFDRHDNRRHHWTRGERLSPQFHSRSYIVNDYRRHGWRAPPRGYAYYRTDTGDVVLAAVATGIITSVIANALAH